MTMNERFAKDLSTNLFNSIYGEMYEIASKAQRGAIRGSVTDEQQNLSDFCNGKMCLADALEYLQIKRAYSANI